MVAAAEDADLPSEALAQQPVPLPHEVERRGDDDGVAAHRVDGEQRHLGLAGAGRQDDDAAPLRRAPRLDRLGLERPGLAAHLQAAVELAVAPRLVLVGDAAADEGPHHRRVRGGRRPEPPGPRVPPAGVGRRRARRPVEAADVERAGGEAEADGRVARRLGHGVAADHTRGSTAGRGSRLASGSTAVRTGPHGHGGGPACDVKAPSEPTERVVARGGECLRPGRPTPAWTAGLTLRPGRLCCL